MPPLRRPRSCHNIGRHEMALNPLNFDSSRSQMPRAEQLWNSFAWSAAPNGRSQEKARVQITGHWRIAIPASPRSSNFVFPMFRFRGGELARAHFDISSTMQARTLVESASMLLDASRSPLQVVLQSPQRSRAVLCYAKRPLLDRRSRGSGCNLGLGTGGRRGAG